MVYLLTLVKEPSWGDSAELALQAFQLGVTHAPGYPVHSLLGKLFSLPFNEPAIATGLLSAVCTSLSISILVHLVHEQTGKFEAAALAGFVLAFSPQIWEYAITTEIYNVNLLFFALSLWLTIQAAQKDSWKWTALAGIVFGLSLGTYLANLLFIPAFWLILVIYPKRRMLIGKDGGKTTEKKLRGKIPFSLGPGVRHLILFSMLGGVFGLLMLSWSVFRSASLPPLGTTCLPTNLADAWCYFSGAQYGSILIQDANFYLGRFSEHTGIFTRNLGYLGLPLGLAGIIFQWRKNNSSRWLLCPLMIIFAIDMGYFTGYRAFDYHTMVAPAYFVFSIWVGWGVAMLSNLSDHPVVCWGVPLMALLVVMGLFGSQAYPRFARSRKTPVIQSSLQILDEAPEDAILVADWSKFTVLVYLQKTRGIRPDVTVIERSKFPRYYEWGDVLMEDYVAAHIKTRSVLVDGWDDSLEPDYQNVQTLSDAWIQIESK